MVESVYILIVDDKVNNLIALEETFHDIDATFIKATSGNDALREILKHDFALAILDVQMPEMDGYELAQLIR
ncbi:MAG: response regulator, partial [Candidatus Electrothrix sp. AUS4]|nr:response regulator [Candidatus Electrothrix sp. AUS4]